MTKHDRNQILLITQGDLDDLKDEIRELQQMVRETNEMLEESAAKVLHNPYTYYNPHYPFTYQISSGSYST